MYLLPIILNLCFTFFFESLLSDFTLIKFLIQYHEQAVKHIHFFQWQIYITNKNVRIKNEIVSLLKSEGSTSKCCTWFMFSMP